MNRRELPDHPLLQALSETGSKKGGRGRTPQASPPSFQAMGTATGAGMAEAGRKAALPSLIPLPRTMLPSRGEGGSQEKMLPEGLSLELAPRLTPTLAASGGFPNRSQVWARCPGRKWGAGPLTGSIPGPLPPHQHRHCLSIREGVGATHALPRSPHPEAPLRRLPPKPDLLLPSSRNLEPLG